jgi:hypothetical protein
MPIHLDADFSRTTFTDSTRKYVDARTGSLVAIYKKGRFIFSAGAGDRVSVITIKSVEQTVSGVVYSAGVRYDAAGWAYLSLALGKDMGTAIVDGGPNFQRYVRVDCVMRLF